MRRSFVICLSVLLLSGCSPKRTTFVEPAVEIVAGRDIVLPGYVLNVKKRDGRSLQGVRVVRSGPENQQSIITADTGTLTEGPEEKEEVRSSDAKRQVVVVRRPVKLTLFDAQMQMNTPSGVMTGKVHQIEFSF